MEVRPFREDDRPGALALGGPVVDAWHARHPSLHLVAADEDRVVGHLQTVDRCVLGSRGEGRGDLILRVAPDHWGNGLPETLLVRAVLFARERGLDRLAAAYLATEPDLESCLLRYGFVPFERYLPSRLRLADFDPARFKVHVEGIRLLTYADAGDTPANRRSLYDLERAARAVQPFREPGAYVPPPFEDWEPELEAARWERLFLALAEGRFVGLVTGLNWAFTGVHPDWQGRGIATALKVWALTVAREAGLETVETENHEDNAPMLAVNLKLGFAFGPPETNCRLLLDP